MLAPDLGPGPYSLGDPRVAAVLDRMHREANADLRGVLGHVGALLGDVLRGRKPTLGEEVERLRHLYASVSRKQGQLLYLAARAVGATRIVEYGTGFGISTTYLAAAVRDNGGGVVIGTELRPDKLETARRNLTEAGLEAYVDLRVGDAQISLRDIGGAVDLVLLDGYLPVYLPLLQQLTPALRRGALVLAMNVNTFRRRLATYSAYVRDPAHGFHSLTLWLGDGVECSVRL